MDIGKGAVTRSAGLVKARLLRWLISAAIVVLATAGLALAAAPPADPAVGKAKPVPATGQHSVPRSLAKGKHQPGEILVKFKPGIQETAVQEKHRQNGATPIRVHKGLRLHQLRLNGQTVEEALARYRKDPDVEYAEPNYLVSIAATPDDFFYSQQWALAKINAPAAWDITTGSGDAVIAIVDGGVDYYHADLLDGRNNRYSILLNQAELGPQNGVDDDGDGFIDNPVYGYNAVKDSGEAWGDQPPHGTAVAGIAGAIGNNAESVAGVAWNVKLLPCKFIDTDGSGTIGNAIACLQYVKTMKERGYHIVATNASWGGPSYSQALYDAIAEQKDTLFVAAAGNEGTDSAFYPAGYRLPNIISVGASDENDAKSDFSNYGKYSVDVSAPGSNIYTLLPGNDANVVSGTSMAAPHVCGLAALLYAQDPTRSAATLKNLILAGADPVPALSDASVTGRRINAYGSLTCSSKQLFAILQAPQAPQANVPQTVSALSIDCSAPVGPVRAAVGDGTSIELRDDGVAPDQVAGDGIFTGTWVPADATVQTLTFSSPAGNSTVTSVTSTPLAIAATPTVSAGAKIVANSATAAATNVAFSLTFPVTGGVAPYTWSLAAGILPDGFTLNSVTGEISGTPAAAGLYAITLQVADSLGAQSTQNWTLSFSDGLRSDFSVELKPRPGRVGGESASPVMADLNGDGKDEVITADLDTLYLVSGDGTTRKMVLPGTVMSPAVADIDGDGQKEIIVSVANSTNSNMIYAFHADLTPVAGFPAGDYGKGTSGYVSSPVVDDLDNDGQYKIAVVSSPSDPNDPSYGQSVIIMVDSRGQMLPGWPIQFGPHLKHDAAPAVGDLHHYGKKELVVTTMDGLITTLTSDLNFNTMLYSYKWDLTNTPIDDAWPAVLGDLDGDGFLDVVVKYHTSEDNMVVALDRNGRPLEGYPWFLYEGSSAPTTALPFGIIASDIDGDGRADIILPGNQFLNILHGNRELGMGVIWLPDLGAVSSNSHPVVADINGDGEAEILFNMTDSEHNSRLVALDQYGNMIPGFPKFVSVGSDVHSTPAICDVDGNGKLDVVVKSDDGMLWTWEMPQPGSVKKTQWPMFRGNAQHAGAIFRPYLDFNDFGRSIYTVVGTSSEPQLFTLKNWSDHAVPVTASVVGADSAEFTIAPGTCGASPFVLGPYQTCNLYVTFSPTGVGNKLANLAATTTDPETAAALQVPLDAHGMPATYQLNYTKAGSGNGTVTSSTGTSYSNSGSEAVASGSTVTLSATPAVGSTFTGWSDGCYGTGVCTVTMTLDSSVTASFALNSYSITATAGANGTISGPASATFGASASYTISPQANYRVADVLVDGVSVGAVTSYSFDNIAANHTISATFDVGSYSITIGAPLNGSISGPATVTYGGSATYTIVPATGYYIVDVTVDSQSVGPVSSYTFTNVTAHHYIGASFYPYSYNISSSSTVGGGITWYSKVNYGTSATFDITPWSGYHVADVVVDGVSVGAVTSYTFTNVTADHSIHAIFAINSYNITATAGANGSISGPAAANYGATAAYTITPATGYHVADVLVDGASVGAVTSYSFSNVTATHTISATFAINSYSITATAGANGSISGPATANYGSTGSYTITPATGYHVADVLVDGVSVGVVTSYSFSNVTANHTISASFAINSYSITAAAGANGSISGPVTANYGSTGSYTITPATGYHVADVLVDGASVGAVTSYSFSNVTATHTISATFAINSYSITATAGANGSISGPATANYGSTGSYTITPATGYHVADVLVDGVSVGVVTSYSFSNVTATHTISASFAINSYSITAAAGANGSISGPVTANYGSTGSYTITPATGYHVADVLVDGASVGAVTSYSFSNVIANHTISATFAVNSYSITAAAGANGSISGPATATYGGSASYSITAAAGYHVADVLVDGVSVGAVTSYSFSNVIANHTISASFAINSYSITAAAGANGSISGPVTANYGSTGSYTITPATGYHVADVLVDGASVGAVTSYSFSNVIANHTISATFAVNSYSITAAAGANGSISGPATATYGGSASYSITAAAGYHVADVLVDGVSVGAVTSYSFSNVIANHTISASFAINSYSITATAGANGAISGPATATYGGSAVYTITPAAGYGIANVDVDGASVGAVSSYTFANVTANHTISATFAALSDLAATSVTGPTSGTRGRTISVSAGVSNQGGGNAGSFKVAFYLSLDGAVSSSDVFLGTQTVSSLNAGGTTTVNASFTVPADMATGKYYVGVIVDSDSVISESNENNNSRAAATSTTIK
jgi:subtilisin family serine protease